MIELLSPVGDFECLKAAVQNGANAVYFGAKSFGARAFASNFDNQTLEEAINYAKLRGVKTNLTLNTLIKENEFEDAFNLAKKAYEFGIDAIIIQDLGLAKELIKKIPDLPLHASTQMTVHNLEGVKLLEELEFKRVVLSRELSLEEIEYICKNSNIEIEVFIHGALCISYSGQCLFSSMIGGRSGNRGKCAQTCRLPYELIEEKNNEILKLDKGYLLSTRDLCSLEYLPMLINSGVTSFKIEGRMKSPEYVATVTKIYRKYIDIALDKTKKYEIEDEDKIKLMQVFNRGGFSHGHLDSSENRNLVFKEKQNNMGLYLGKVLKFNKNKGIITSTVQSNLSVGDGITFEKEPTKYTVSELLNKNQNIKEALPNQTVSFGRMKGSINIGDKIYKISGKNLSDEAKNSYSKENVKNKLDCILKIKNGEKIFAEISCPQFNISTNYIYDYIPEPAVKTSITKETIISKFNKTLDTEFEFTNFNIGLDDNLFIPVSVLNDIRRTGINMIREKIINSFKHNSVSSITLEMPNFDNKNDIKNTKISLLLNNLNFDYTKLNKVDKLYIPLKYFLNDKYYEFLNYFSNNFNLYIYLPTIIRKNSIDLTKNTIEKSLNKYNIKGIVISSLSELKLLPKNSNNLDIVGNYTLNLYNTFSAKALKDFDFSCITISPELDENGIINLSTNQFEHNELIVYGNIPVMTMNYCPLGKSNKCYKDCKRFCMSSNKYFLKDRMGFLFRIVPDNLQTISTIYNTKTTSINFNDYFIDFARIDILDENISEINNIIETVKNGTRFEGKNFTNGNLKREI